MKRIASLILPLALMAGAVFMIWFAPPVTFSRDTLSIHTAHATHSYTVEIAATPRQQAQGLMHRPALRPSHGMLFILPDDEPIRMWMKDTLVSLDMLFIDSAGRIVYIARDTVPGSTDFITPDRPVRGVLEIPAGSARAQGIEIGDRVIHSHFAP